MFNWENYFSETLTGLISAIASGLAAWLFGRSRQSKEVKALEIDLVERVATMWRQMSEELKLRIDKQDEEIERLNGENGRLREEVTTLKRDNISLTKRLKKFIDNHGE